MGRSRKLECGYRLIETSNTKDQPEAQASVKHVAMDGDPGPEPGLLLLRRFLSLNHRVVCYAKAQM
jgi:hypothetical protein